MCKAVVLKTTSNHLRRGVQVRILLSPQNIAGWCSGSTVKKQPIFDRELYSNFTKQTPT